MRYMHRRPRLTMRVVTAVCVGLSKISGEALIYFAGASAAGASAAGAAGACVSAAAGAAASAGA